MFNSVLSYKITVTKKPQDFIDEQLKSTKEPIPEYDYSFNHTHFHNDKLTHTADNLFGAKIIDNETPHKDVIGVNKDICRKLYGLGQVLEKQGIKGFKLGPLDNHVWLYQTNLKDGEPMKVCFNCGSLILNNKFIPYTDLKK